MMTAAQQTLDAYMTWEEWDRQRQTMGVRDFTAQPLRKVRTAAQEFAAFCRELDDESAKLSAEDAALLARLEALPVPGWVRAMADYQTHAQRMRAWYRELDKSARPLVWRAINVDRALTLAECRVSAGDALPADLWGKPDWPEKRRDEVQRIAAARGDTFAEGMQGPVLL